MAVLVRDPDVDAFIELSWQLNAHDPSWISSDARAASTGTDRHRRFRAVWSASPVRLRVRRPSGRASRGDRQPAPGGCERTSDRPGGLFRVDRRRQRLLGLVRRGVRVAPDSGGTAGLGSDERRPASQPSLHDRRVRSPTVSVRGAESALLPALVRVQRFRAAFTPGTGPKRPATTSATCSPTGLC